MWGYLALSIGIMLAQIWQAPAIYAWLFLIASLIPIIYLRLKIFPAKHQLRNHLIFWLLLFVLGASYSSLRINWRQHNLISNNISNLSTHGYLISPVTAQNNYKHAEFHLTSGSFAGQNIQLTFPESMNINAGMNYQLTINLQAIQANNNFNAFDYRQYLIAQDITANGFVSSQPLQLSKNYTPQAQINLIRTNLISYLQKTLSSQQYAGLAIALVTGYQQLIPDSQWQMFKNSGIVHIVSISGLHITLVALIAIALANFILKRLPPTKIPRQIIIVWIGVSVALLYSLLAGFSIPTQRTFYLLLITAYLMTRRKAIPLVNKLTMTLALILIIDPFACLNIGFWFSFSLVAVIFMITENHRLQTTKLKLWLHLQLAIILVSLPLSVYYFGSYPFIASIANLWAIPILGNFLTPIILFSSLLHWSWLIQFSCGLFDYAMLPIQWLAKFPVHHQMKPDLYTVALAYSGIALILLPRSIKLKNYIGMILFISLFVIKAAPSIPYGQTQIIAFNNLQTGFALLQTQQHNFLIVINDKNQQLDKQFQYTVLPYLQAQNIQTINYVIQNQQDTQMKQVLKQNSINLKNDDLPTTASIDGIELQILKNDKQLALIAHGINEDNYIGSGITPSTNNNNWTNIVILYPLSKPSWIFQQSSNNLLINHAKNDISASSILDNLNLPAKNVRDLNIAGSQLIRHHEIINQEHLP